VRIHVDSASRAGGIDDSSYELYSMVSKRDDQGFVKRPGAATMRGWASNVLRYRWRSLEGVEVPVMALSSLAAVVLDPMVAVHGLIGRWR
jgi:hypothetical protein